MAMFRSDINLNRNEILDRDKKHLDQEELLIQAKKENLSLIVYGKY